MAKGRKTGGRTKGTPNKLSSTVKQSLADAFERVRFGNAKGGVDSLVAWGNEKPDEFYKLWARLLPVEMEHSADGSLAALIASSFKPE